MVTVWIDRQLILFNGEFYSFHYLMVTVSIAWQFPLFNMSFIRMTGYRYMLFTLYNGDCARLTELPLFSRD